MGRASISASRPARPSARPISATADNSAGQPTYSRNTKLQGIVSNLDDIAAKVRPAAQAMAVSLATIGSGPTSLSGGELNYNHMSHRNWRSDSLGPILVPGANLADGSTVLYNVTVTSAASVSIHDYRDGARARRLDLRPLHALWLCRSRGRPGRRSRFATLGRQHRKRQRRQRPPRPPLTAHRFGRATPKRQAQTAVVDGFTAGLGIDGASSRIMCSARANGNSSNFPMSRLPRVNELGASPR